MDVMLAPMDDDMDSGAKSAQTERLCALTRDVRSIADMIRFVVDPDGNVVPDLARKLPGRGVWITASRDALAQATRKKIFSRSFKRDVCVHPNLPEQVDRLLEQRTLSALSLLNKAGGVITGFEKVAQAIEQQSLAVLVHASDAAPDGVRKLNGALKKRYAEDFASPMMIDIFAGAHLDLALGRSNVVHAAILALPASAGFILNCQRLITYRAGQSCEQQT
jgi:uncharacterized protein